MSPSRWLRGMSSPKSLARQSNFRVLPSTTVKKCCRCCWRPCMKTATKFQKSLILSKRIRMIGLIKSSPKISGMDSPSVKSQFSLISFTASLSPVSAALSATTSALPSTLTTCCQFLSLRKRPNKNPSRSTTTQHRSASPPSNLLS